MLRSLLNGALRSRGMSGQGTAGAAPRRGLGGGLGSGLGGRRGRPAGGDLGGQVGASVGRSLFAALRRR